jgi:hypothetical protein
MGETWNNSGAVPNAPYRKVEQHQEEVEAISISLPSRDSKKSANADTGGWSWQMP